MTATINAEQIRLRAYHLWEAEGRPFGRDQEYWFRAEQQFAPHSPTTKSPASKRRSPARKPA